MRAAFHSAVSWLSSVMIFEVRSVGGGRVQMQSKGRTVLQRNGRSAPLRQTARKIRRHGLVFPRSTSKGGHGLPSSRFERVLVGAYRVRLLRSLYMHGENQSKNRKYSD